MKAKVLFLFFLSLITPVLSAQDSDLVLDRGFVHPGGLHTEADFARVKAQLESGNTLVKQAYQKLTSAAYSQSSVQTYPVETIVRGGSGENYINAARGATMAYQNALRWKISGSVANAKAAVRILMAWANTTKAVSGSSDQCLAVGLYGYQFAQAAELMRDYSGWDPEDFATFKRWMLTVWYPKAINFLRGRNGTWENTSKWWKAPGHYWSNWGLCNVLCVMSIGILCDDVFIYNQGLSYFKYDMCGTFKDPRTAVPILNDGLTEFLGNLVVTTSASDLETGAYGQLGQMNESGRDTGHSSMALGLAVDIAKVGWNQGDDLFAYMNHRLAAGIEYVAAQTQSVEGLPWTNYHYGSSGYHYSDNRAWLMEGPALGAQMRPYWGTVIGIYEGVKGVRMPFSEVSYKNMGIDEGGQGGTSGGYDHLGYSVLMNTRDEQLCPEEKVPTELSPRMEYSGTLTSSLIPSLTQERARGCVNGKIIEHGELGGLVNTYTLNNNTTVPVGQTLTLQPQLPEGEEDTGLWRWNTGETTREITVNTDRSYIYRVTYTNARGIDSQLAFSVAVTGDCTKDALNPKVTIAGSEAINASDVRVPYGKTATLSVEPSAGWGTYKWTGNKTTQSITTSALRSSQTYTVEFKNQGGAVTEQTFHLDVLAAEPYAKVNDADVQIVEEGVLSFDDGALVVPRPSVLCNTGANVTLGLKLPSVVQASSVEWSTGATGATLVLTDVVTSGTYTATFVLSGIQITVPFEVFVRPTGVAMLEPGKYLLRHVASDTYLTSHGLNQLANFESRDEENASQLWLLEKNATPKYGFVSLADTDSLRLNSSAKTAVSSSLPFYVDNALGSDRIALRTGTTSSPKYWGVSDDGSFIMNVSSKLLSFPFQLIPIEGPDAVEAIHSSDFSGNFSERSTVYDLAGRRVGGIVKGVYIVSGKKILVK